MQHQLEVCVDRIDDALVAIEAGATRIEFNCALAEDGLTPSLGCSRSLRRATPQPIVAMVRPHNCGFCYTPSEKQAMLEDCEGLLDAGMDGLVLGSLTPTGQLDCEFLETVAKRFGSTALIMPRAFDRLSDQASGLETLIELGFCRVLTSGNGATVPAGIDSLQALIQQARGRIEILPGGGVRSSNAEQILRRTGATQLHGSFSHDQHGFRVPSSAEITAVRRILNQHAPASQ